MGATGTGTPSEASEDVRHHSRTEEGEAMSMQSQQVQKQQVQAVETRLRPLRQRVEALRNQFAKTRAEHEAISTQIESLEQEISQVLYFVQEWSGTTSGSGSQQPQS